MLKIADMAVYGAAFLIVYWKTRNLLGMAIVHGLNDLIPSITDEIFVMEAAEESAGYTSGSAGTTVVYFIQLAVGVLVLIHVYKKVWKTIDPEKLLEEW